MGGRPHPPKRAPNKSQSAERAALSGGEFAHRVPLLNLLTRRRIRGILEIPFLCATDQPATPSWQQHHHQRQPRRLHKLEQLRPCTATTTTPRRQLDSFSTTTSHVPRAPTSRRQSRLIATTSPLTRLRLDAPGLLADTGWRREDARGCCIAGWELYAGQHEEDCAIVTSFPIRSIRAPAVAPRSP